MGICQGFGKECFLARGPPSGAVFVPIGDAHLVVDGADEGFDSFAGLGRNGDGACRLKIPRGGTIDFVYDGDGGNLVAYWQFVLRGVGGVEDYDQQIALGDFRPAGGDGGALDGVFGLAEAGGVDEEGGHAGDVG